MKSVKQAFTLIELLMVMLIIGIVIAMLMRIGPEVSRNIKVHQTQNFIHVLDLGAHRYKQVFGAFPPDGGERNAANGKYIEAFREHRTGGSLQKRAAFYLYIGLQGPDSYGWSRIDHGVSADFGPFLEAGATNVGQKQIGDNNSTSWPAFIDGFNKAILYLKARRSKDPNLDSAYGHGDRYNPLPLRAIWGGQTGIGGWQAGGMWNVYSAHWKEKLTATRRGGSRVPHNPDSFVLWSSGPDEKFGYWFYDEEELGLHFNLQLGTCDDITNFD